MTPLFATSTQDALTLINILGAALSATLCGSIVFLTGSGQGKISLAVTGAVIAVGFAAYSRFWYSIPLAVALSILITLIPRFNRSLLSDSEVEAEMRRARMM